MVIRQNHGGSQPIHSRSSHLRLAKTFPLLKLSAVITLASFTLYPDISLARYSQLDDVRIGHHPDKVRVVFDLDQNTQYKLFTLKDPHRLVLDFNDTQIPTKIKAQLKQAWLKDTPIKRFRTGIRGYNDLRVVFDLSQEVSSRSFTLKNPNRLVIDITYKSTTTNTVSSPPKKKTITKQTVATSPITPTKPKAPVPAPESKIDKAVTTTSEPQTLDLHLLDYQVKKFSLDDALPTYSQGESLWIDFNAFLRASEFSINQTTPFEWSGFFFSEDNTFILDLQNHTVTINGQVTPLDPKTVIEHDDTWLVKHNDITAWFGIELQADYRRQILTASSNKLFPIEERYLRYANRNRYVPVSEEPVFLRDDYHWITSPRTYIQGNINHLDNDGITTDTGSLSVTTSMDLLKHQTYYTGTITDSSGSSTNTTQRLTFSRYGDTQDDTLALGARYYEFGDVFYSGNNLANRGGSGEGFVIARQTDTQTLSKGVTTIAGDAPPGWDAELYRNNQLLDFTRTTQDGRYRFIDQQTQPGKNVFTVRLYGPQGQYEEQQQLIWGGGLELDPGDYSYRLTHIDYDQTLLEGKFNGADVLPAHRTRSAEFTYGFNQDLQLGVGYFDQLTGVRDNFGQFTDERYYQANFRANLFTGVLLGEWNQQENAGQAWQANYLGNINDRHSYSLNYQSFDTDFTSPYNVRAIPLDDQIELSLFGRPKTHWLDAYDLRVSRDKQSNGVEQDELFNRLSRRFGKVYVSNEITYRNADPGDETYRGALKMSGRYKHYSLSGQLDYDPADSKPATQAQGTVRWQLSRNLYTNIQLSKQLRDNHTTFINSELTWQHKAVDISLKASANTDDFWSVGIGFSTTLDYNPYKKTLYAKGDNMADKGRAAFNVFVDDNKNQKLDHGEEIVEQVSYRDIDSVNQQQASYIPLDNLPKQNNYRIDTQKIVTQDPYLVAANRYYNIYTHAGSAITFNLPVYNSGDIEGYLLRYTNPDDADSIMPSPGVEIELRNQKGEVVAATTSEFDGYYSFNTVPVGNYSIVTRSTKGFFQEHERFFELDKEDNYREVDNVILTTDRPLKRRKRPRK
ncbi:hypothetical protein R50073_10710 [Maricurvus nonylphenolicus]|uniref:AMIN domain-containing protein n=1 Tax=Maricurvus nonylphenolicus TaxID=1008307 RepID=UPI0036F2D917